jgi:hypothetical protein
MGKSPLAPLLQRGVRNIPSFLKEEVFPPFAKEGKKYFFPLKKEDK